MTIAEACRLADLGEDVLAVALDTQEPEYLRSHAVSVLHEIGDDSAKERLRPLALEPTPDDENKDIMGWAIATTWPHHVTSEELFAQIPPCEDDSFVGSYRSFVSYHLPDRLRPEDLLPALRWVSRTWHEGRPDREFGKLIDAIITLSWENLEREGVFDAFVDILLAAAERYGPLLGHWAENAPDDFFLRDARKRLRVLEHAVSRIKEPDEGARQLSSLDPRLVVSSDVPWMLDKLQEERPETEQKTWAQLIACLHNREDARQTDLILKIHETNPHLSEVFALRFRAVNLDSDDARRSRQHREWAKANRQAREESKVLPCTQEQLKEYLDKCEEGNTDPWWWMVSQLTYLRGNQRVVDDPQPDITQSLEWEESDAAVRSRLVNAARQYVLAKDPREGDWLATDEYYRPDMAAYKALRLLQTNGHGILVALPPSIWHKWTPIILAYPLDSGSGDETPDHELVSLAYAHAPDVFLAVLDILIDRDVQTHDNVFILDKLRLCWDDRLAAWILEKAKGLPARLMTQLLREVLRYDIPEGREYVAQLLSTDFRASEEAMGRALGAAAELFSFARDAAWPMIWPVVLANPQFGEDLFLRISDSPFRASGMGVAALSDPDLGRLYLWLAKHFPHAEDPKHWRSSKVTPRDELALWRRSILSELKRRATPEACQVIRRIKEQLPDIDGLAYTLLEAEKLVRRRSWAPPSPRDLLELMRENENRLISSGNQLLAVIVESLNRLQDKLHGETPSARFLWNEIQHGKWGPKKEEDLSDYVKNHFDDDLRDRGIVMGREVQIHRGQKTDIHVDAVKINHAGQPEEIISAIVEVKCLWNEELKKAMEEQLLGRYLSNNPCGHGLYLVGWYDCHCDEWDDRDSKKRKAPRMSLDKARDFFRAEASRLSNDIKTIQAFVLDVTLR